MRFLVGVHRAAEHEHGVVGVERARRLGAPREAPFLEPVSPCLDGVAEDARTDLLAVDDCEDVHHRVALTGTLADWSSRCKVFAFAAACAIRPPCPSGLVELLLKNA